MNLGAVMDELGDAVDGIEGLRVFPYWADRITPPAAIVGFPDQVDYDSTLARGSDQMQLSVMVFVGRADARSTRDQLAKYAAGSGDDSVKAAIDGATKTSYSSARVARVEFGTALIAGVEYLSATFHVDITGQGA